MSKVVIIGSGPAGVSAALYTQRAGFETTIISNGGGALLKAEKVENYYGFADGISGEKLYNDGIDGAKRLGVEFINDEVVSLSIKDNFIVKTTRNDYSADAVLLATGLSRLAPNIKGLKDFEGMGVSYCAVCDSFFFRSKNVGVIGNGEYALHETKELLNVVGSVTVYTNGEKPLVEFPENVVVKTDKIQSISGKPMALEVNFEDGSDVINGLFVAYKTAGSTALAKKVGATIDGNRIVVNDKMQTNIKGLFAAGDCTGGLLQISKAVYEGAQAGTEIIKYLKEKNKQ